MSILEKKDRVIKTPTILLCYRCWKQWSSIVTILCVIVGCNLVGPSSQIFVVTQYSYCFRGSHQMAQPSLYDWCLLRLLVYLWVFACVELKGKLTTVIIHINGDMEALPTLLALCEGNPTVVSGFPSQRASNMALVMSWHGIAFHIQCCWELFSIVGPFNVFIKFVWVPALHSCLKILDLKGPRTQKMQNSYLSTSLHITNPFKGNPPVTGGFPSKGFLYRKCFLVVKSSCVWPVSCLQ